MTLTTREIAVMELIKSEQRFVDDLEKILKIFIQPLIECQILSSSQIDALFVNWPSLTRTHEKFANDLIESLKIDGKQIPIGKVFLRSFPLFLTEYEMFFRFHCVAMKCFREKLVNSSEFRSFMNETKRQTSGIGSLGDANILTLPLQRLSIYPILLGQIFKATPEENFDRNDLENALEKANELRATINNVIDDEINRIKFDWLEKHVDSRKIHDEFFWNSFTHFGDQRQLIHYGPIRCSSKGFLLDAMLFNDFLLLTRRKNRFLTKIRRIFHRKKSNIDLFDDDQIDLIIFKKPIFLHEIRNVRMIDENSNEFQFDYRARQLKFFSENFNERFLWIKHLNETIERCRHQRVQMSMLRAPKLSDCSSPVATLIVQTIRAIDLPIPTNRWNPYCIIEMNHGQRQTTDVLWDSNEIQWKIFFRFSIFHFDFDRLKCSIYNRAKFTIDRLLGSIELPISSLIDRRSCHDDFSSIYSFTTFSQQTDVSSNNSLQRSFELEHSSTNSQLFIQYVYQVDE